MPNNYARCGWSMPINHQKTEPRMTSNIFFVFLNKVNSIHNAYKFYEINGIEDNESLSTRNHDEKPFLATFNLGHPSFNAQHFFTLLSSLFDCTLSE